MHIFDYEEQARQSTTPEIVSMVAQISEYKGRHSIITEVHKDEMNSLLEVAKIQSTGASNKIEGIFTTDKRLQELVMKKA